MEPADVTFGLSFRFLVEVHLLNSPLKVDMEHRHGDSLSPAAVLTSWKLLSSVLLSANETLFTKVFERCRWPLLQLIHWNRRGFIFWSWKRSVRLQGLMLSEEIVWRCFPDNKETGMFVIGWWPAWDHLDSCHLDNCTEKVSCGTSLSNKKIADEGYGTFAIITQPNVFSFTRWQLVLLCLLRKLLFIYSFLLFDGITAPRFLHSGRQLFVLMSWWPPDVFFCVSLWSCLGRLTDLTITSTPKRKRFYCSCKIPIRPKFCRFTFHLKDSI